jgi:3-oxoacyl-[acyl-carrier-protein] synthase II
MSRIVVTGIGMITAVGLDKETTFNNILAGKTGVDTISSFDASDYSVQIAAEIKDFDPATVMNKKDIKKADRFIQLGLKAAKEAMSEAGFETIDSESFGVSCASGIGGLPAIEKNSVIIETRGPRRVSPFFIPSALVNMLAGFVSIEFGLKGPNIGSVTACAAGTHAITDAYKTMKCGMANKMLVVGGEAAISPIGIAGFANMKALSTRNDDPAHASRPFDKDRDGFIMGEGAGALVLEKYEDAVARGAKIYGEIVGIGESGDANHITTPTLDGPLRAMKMAWEMAGKPNIDYVNAHGTSTATNDKNETIAIKQLLSEHIPLVSSTKGATGHCLGAAGAIESVISLMAMDKGILPPTINFVDGGEDCDLDYIPNEPREADVKYIMKNSFGFGGTNGVIIFKKV